MRWRKCVLSAWIAGAASIVLITAVLTASAKPGASSFYGSSAHGTYALFIQTECAGSCLGGPASAVVQVTAGQNTAIRSPCPFGTNQLPSPAIVNGTFTTGGWYFIAKKEFVWFWVFGRLVPGVGIVGVIKTSPVCGRPDSFTLRAGSV